MVEVGEWGAQGGEWGAEQLQLWAAARGVEGGGRVHRFARLPRAEWHRGSAADPAGDVTRMPATVLALAAAEGAEVRRGDTLLVLESMKMEIRLRAHADGRVAFLVAAGQQVKEGTRLLTLK